MQQSNAFASVAADVVQGGYDEDPSLKLSTVDGRLRLSEAPLNVGLLPASANLLSVSNAGGLLVAGTSNGFVLARLEDVRKAFAAAPAHQDTPFSPLRAILTSSPVVAVHFGHRDQTLLVSLAAGGVAVYSVAGLLDGSKLDPEHVLSVPMPIAILPNPGERSELIAILTAECRVSIVDLTTRAVIATFGEQVTAFCWSVLGKQITVGGTGCQLQQYTPDGELKSTTAAPPSDVEVAVSHIADIRWLENMVLVVSYGPNTPSPSALSPIFAVLRAKDTVSFVKLEDPAYPSPDYATRQSRRLVASLKDWSPYKHILFLANATSNQLAVFGSNRDSGAWATLEIDEAVRPVMPSTVDFADTVPLGVAVDLVGTEPLVLKGSEEPLPPAPVLLAFTSQGLLVAWKVRVASNAPYPGMLAPSSMALQAPTMLAAHSGDAMETSTPSLATSAAPSPFTQTSMAPANVANISSFGASTLTPSFGQNSIPSINKPSMFGGTGFAQAAFGTSAFGKPTFPSSPFSSASQAISSTPAPTAQASPFVASAGSGFSGFAAKSSGGAFAGFASKPDVPSSSAFGAPNAIKSAATPSFGQFGSSSEQKTTFGAAGSTVFGFGASPSTSAPSKASSFSFSNVRSGGDDEDDMADDGLKGTVDKPRSVLDDPDDLEPSGKSASSGLSFGDMGLGRASSVASDTAPKGFAPMPGASAFGASAFSRPADVSAPAFAAPPSLPPVVVPPASEAPRSTASSAFGAPSFGQSAFGQSSFGKSGFTGFGGSAAVTQAKVEPAKPPQVTGSAFSGFAASKSSFSPAAPPSTSVKAELQPEPKKPASAFSAFSSSNSTFPAPSTPAAKVTVPAQSLSSPFAALSSSKSRFAASEEIDEAPPRQPVDRREEQRPDDRHHVESKKAASVQTKTEGTSFAEPPSNGLSLVANSSEIVSPSTEAADDPASNAADWVSESEDAGSESAEAADDDHKSPDNQPQSTAKALFGLASSPPVSKASSLLERLGPRLDQPELKVEPEQDKESDPELEDESYEEESDEEGAQKSGDEEGSGATGSKEELEDSEDIATDEDDASEGEAAPRPEKTPSLLERLQAAPKAEQKPAASISTSPFASFGGFKPPSAPRTEEQPEKTAASRASSSPFPALGSRASPLPPAESFDAESASSSRTITPPQEGDKPATGSKTVVAPPAFSFVAPAASKPAAAQSSKGFFSFASSAPRMSSPLASPAPSNVPESKGSLFGTPQKASAPATSSSTLAHAPSVQGTASSSMATQEQKASSVSLDPKVVPAVSMPATKQVAIKKTGDNLVDQHLQLIAIMKSDLTSLQASLSKCKEHAKLLGEAQWPTDAAPELNEMKIGALTLGNLPQLEAHTQHLKFLVESSGESSRGRKRKLAELQNQIVKIRQKQEECGRLLRAKDDPNVATRVKARGLGSEQAENQKRLRRSSTAVADSLSAIEAQVARLRERMTEEELGRPGYRAPSLDSIQRTVRNISIAVSARSQELDDMTRQLSALELRNSPKPSRRREATASPSPASVIPRAVSVTADGATPVKAMSAHVDGVEAMRRNAALQEAILAIRSRPLLTKSPSPPSLFTLPPLTHSHEKEEMPAAISERAAGGLRAPAKIEFSFAGLASQVSAAAAGGGTPPSGARQRSASGRTHTSAVKVQPRMEQAEPKASTFEWGDLPSSLQSTPPRRVSSSFEGLQPPQLLSDVQKQEGLALHKTERLYGDEEEGTASESEILHTISEGEEEEDP